MPDRTLGAVWDYTCPIPSAKGVRCHMCGLKASHKVEEVTEDLRHPLTTYVCCGCFGQIMGSLAVRSCFRAQELRDKK